MANNTRTRVFRILAGNLRHGDFVMPTYFNGHSPDGFTVTSVLRHVNRDGGSPFIVVDIIGNDSEGTRTLQTFVNDVVMVERTYPIV